jgi:hypothetical protein
MKKHLSHVSRLGLLFVAAVVLIAQTDHTNAFTGTWKLNAAKSQYSPGPGPQSATVTIAPDGRFTLKAVDPQGRPGKYSYPWSVGQEVPVDGIRNATVSTTLQGRTADRTMKIEGKTVQTAHAVVSPDGKTMTVTVEVVNPQGQAPHIVEVYEKQ